MFGTKVNINKEETRQILDRRVETFYPSRQEVEKRLEEGKKLRIYYGIDPTGPDIHLGHTVQLFFMKKLAEMGHEIILLIGDFTARIGDPTDKEATRKPLSEQEVSFNMKNYMGQAYKIIPKICMQFIGKIQRSASIFHQETIGNNPSFRVLKFVNTTWKYCNIIKHIKNQSV